MYKIYQIGEYMKSYHKELFLDIPNRMEFINITSDVEEVLCKLLRGCELGYLEPISPSPSQNPRS